VRAQTFAFSLACLLPTLAGGVAYGANVWTTSGVIPGGFVASITYAAGGATAFAGGIGVVYRSTDDGGTWVPSALPSAFARSVVLAIATDPANKLTLLASTQDYGIGGTTPGNAVLVSDDGGKTWTQGAGLDNQVRSGNTQYPYFISWDPNVSGTAYAATEAGSTGEVYRTTNGGKNWAQRYLPGNINQPFVFGPIAAVPTKPTSIFIAANDFNYASDGDEFLAKSVNGAGSFSFSDPLGYVGYAGYGSVLTRFAYNPKTPTTVYALASGYQTTNGVEVPYLQLLWTPNSGTNWVDHVAGLPKTSVGSALVVDPASGAVVMPVCCASHHQLFLSANQGKTWAALSTMPASSLDLAVKPGVAPGKPAILLDAGHGGGLASIDGGKTWTSSTSGMKQPNIADVLADPTAPTDVYVGTKSGVWRSADGGASFSDISDGLTDLNVQALAIDVKAAKHVLYAATITGIYRCEDATAAKPVWTEITPPAMAGRAGTYALSVDAGTAGRLYVSNVRSSPREIYRTDNFGAAWVTTGFNRATGNDFPQAMIADPKFPGTIYATAEDFGGIYKSTNAGASFTEILNGPNGSKFVIGEGDALNPRTVYLRSVDPNSGQTTILRSTDGGKTWDTNANAAPGGGYLLDFGASPTSSTLYALVALSKSSGGIVTYSLGVFESPNRGFSWTAITGNLPQTLQVGTAGTITTPALLRPTGGHLVVTAPFADTLFLQTIK